MTRERTCQILKDHGFSEYDVKFHVLREVLKRGHATYSTDVYLGDGYSALAVVSHHGYNNYGVRITTGKSYVFKHGRTLPRLEA